MALLDFITDFSNWDNSTRKEYLETSRVLTQSAHEALGGEPGTRPLVVDPFAGGGSIPLEAIRVGADAFASDLNPVAVLLNKVVLEYIPKYGQILANELRKWGEQVKKEAEKQLSQYYPNDPDGKIPVAYLWARTITCEGPRCGARIPIIPDLLLARRKNQNITANFTINADTKTIGISIHDQPKTLPIPEGTVRRSSVTCPICNYTTPATDVRKQFHNREGGTKDAQLISIVTTNKGNKTRFYREATNRDLKIVQIAQQRVASLLHGTEDFSPIPNETLPYLRSIFNVHLLGVTQWGQLFSARQALQLATFSKIICGVSQAIVDQELSIAVVSCLGVALDKMADFHTSLSSWISVGEKIGHTFGRQALGIIWDFAEANPFADISGSWDRCINYIVEFINCNEHLTHGGNVQQSSATENPLPNDSASAIVADPPYYDLIPYADLSDFFYVWLKRTVGHKHKTLFNELLSPKQQEIVQLSERNPMYAYKTRENFERLMKLAMEENRRIIMPLGIGIIIFAHRETLAWESQLQAMIDAGWIITGSWPIDTEREGRLRAMNSAVLASTIQLVCRPRKNADGSLRVDSVGDWRDVLGELPKRIHEWMPRLGRGRDRRSGCDICLSGSCS